MDIKASILLPVVILTISCSKSETKTEVDPKNNQAGQLEERDSRDLTDPDLFTSGIEGPAVSADGNIYAVNFNEQGTIGKVTPEGIASHFVSLPEGALEMEYGF